MLVFALKRKSCIQVIEQTKQIVWIGISTGIIRYITGESMSTMIK